MAKEAGKKPKRYFREGRIYRLVNGKLVEEDNKKIYKYEHIFQNMPLNIKALKELRQRLNLSQYKFALALGRYVVDAGLAEKCSFTPQTINNWEQGRNTPPLRVADYLSSFARAMGYQKNPPAYLSGF